MELTDVEYMDELCCGIENKLGASVPHCLLRPMFDNFNAPPRYTSSSGGKSFNRTPPGSVEMLAASQRCSTPEVHQRKHDGKMAPGLEEEDMHGTSPTDDVTLRHLSPVKQLVVKHDKLQESCHKLKTSMSALRAVDLGLLKHFLTIYDAIEELRWMSESYDMSDSCESINSSMCESIEQIHEKWMSERRQWQSASSRDLSSWRDDSRSNLSRTNMGRLNSVGASMQPQANGQQTSREYGLPSLQNTLWRSPQTEMNSSFPQLLPGGSCDFERQRRSSVDHIPKEAPQSTPSPGTLRKRRSSSGALEAGITEKNEKEGSEMTADPHAKKIARLQHSKSSPAFDPRYDSIQVTNTAMI
ncbi:uncharacterized protein LOC117298061 isoform X2 [Asterias rubens]|nr:uncharacterized protein LOC117298061 isoform X2 [Asterias rubens]